MAARFLLDAHISPLVAEMLSKQPAHYDGMYAEGKKLPGVADVKAKRIPQADAPGLARAIQKLALAIDSGGDPLGIYFLV